MKNIFGNKHFIKTGVCVLFIILCSVLLVIGCPVPEELQNIPEGMGTFSLQLEGSDQQSRTIMPGTGAANNRFAVYRLVFTGGPTTGIDEDRSFGEISNPIELIPGSYTLTVSGYTSQGNRTANKPAVQGSGTIVITAGQAATGTVTLTPIAYSAGQKGVFDLNLTFTGDIVDAVKMELQPVSAGSNLNYNIIGGSDPIGADADIDLDPGQYRVIFTLEKAGMNPVIWREVLHIAGNMTSSYTKEFTISHFVKAYYDVKFNYNDGVRTPFELTYFYDEFTSIARPNDPTRTGYTFDRWYKDAECTAGNHWVFGDNLTPGIELFAKWIPDFPGTVTINILTNVDGSEVEVDDRTRVNLGEVLVARITSGNPGPFVYRWIWTDGTDIVKSPEDDPDKLLIHDGILEIGGVITVTVSLEGHSNLTSTKLMTLNSRPGTPGNPFEIRFFSDLIRLSTGGRDGNNNEWTLNSHYVQMANITQNTTQTLNPIGTNTASVDNPFPFTGSYNGNGFQISNLNITNATRDNLGLFAVNEGTISNVVLYNTTLNGRDNVGGIAGQNKGTIENSSVSASGIGIDGRDNIGGITGLNTVDGTVKNSKTSGNIHSRRNNIGGITGENIGKVEFCYSISNIICSAGFAGGITGKNNGTLENNIALNPNITAYSLDAGRVAGNVSASPAVSTGNAARSDMSIRMIIQDEQGTEVAAGEAGTAVTVPSATAVTSIFHAPEWNRTIWDVPGNNIAVSAQLPRLVIQKPIGSPLAPTPYPTLPQVIQRTGQNSQTISNIDVTNFLRHNVTPGTPGWYLKRIEGEWDVGEMLEFDLSKPIEVPEGFKAQISGVRVNDNWSSNTMTASLGAIGSFIVVKGTTAQGITLTFNLSIPVVYAEMQVYIFGTSDPRPANPTFRVPYTGSSTISRNFTYGTGQSNFPNNTQFDVVFIIETEENWEFVPDTTNKAESYVVFRSEDTVTYGDGSSVSNTSFYWLEGELGKSNLGNVRYYDGTDQAHLGKKFIQPTVDEVRIMITAGSNNAEVWVPSSAQELSYYSTSSSNLPSNINEVLWIADTLGPDRTGSGTLWNEPITIQNPRGQTPSRITRDVVINTMGVEETVGIVMITVNHVLTASAANNTAYTISGNQTMSVVVDFILNADFDSAVRTIEVVQATGMSGITVSPTGQQTSSRSFTLSRTGNPPNSSQFNFTTTFRY
ncbi:MAG: InlB B-repeat-containing protein [Treponema sp.]|nr:InlB B-repeat-containing protein [Treponema sp.]